MTTQAIPIQDGVVDSTISIRITGVTTVPSWDSLEKLVASAVGKPGQFVTIRKTSGEPYAYRAPGVYEATYITHDGLAFRVVVDISVSS